MENSLDFKIGVIYGYAFCKAQSIVESNSEYRFLNEDDKLQITKNITNEIMSGLGKGDSNYE